MKLVCFCILVAFTIVACKTKPIEAVNARYFVFIDAVLQTDTGLIDTQIIDTIYCADDNSAIDRGLEEYYKKVVNAEVQKEGTDLVKPYVTEARGWAVLDERGENVKHRVRNSYVDSSNARAVESARNKIEHLRQQ
jgi:hypothetical protein